MIRFLMGLTGFFGTREPWRFGQSIAVLFLIISFCMLFDREMFVLMIIFLFLSAITFKQVNKMKLFFNDFWEDVAKTDGSSYSIERTPLAVEIRNQSLGLMLFVIAYGWFWVFLIDAFNLPQFILLHVFAIGSGFAAWAVDGVLEDRYVKVMRLRPATETGWFNPTSGTLRANWRKSQYYFTINDYSRIFWQVFAFGLVVFVIQYGSDVLITLSHWEHNVLAFHAEAMTGLSLKPDVLQEITLDPSVAPYVEFWNLLGQVKDKVAYDYLSVLVRPYV